MKTLSKIFVTLFIGLLSLNAFAEDGNAAYFKVATVETDNVAYSIYAVKNAEQIKFSFERLGDANVVVKIYNAEYNLVYTDVVKNREEGRISYNLSELGEGTYHVKVATKGFTKTHTFKVGAENFNANFAAYVSPKHEGNKVQVAFQNAFAPVAVKVYDAEGVVYHDELISKEADSKMLNLAQLTAGEYIVEVSSEGKSATKSITIE